MYPGSELNNLEKDVFLENGVISKTGSLSFKADLEIDGSGCFLTPGLFDLRARHGEPGLEQNEDIASLSQTAANGGFTGVATLPDTEPCIQTKAQIEFQLNKAKEGLVELYPFGATTKDLEGVELNEIFDMHRGGAIGFSNGDHSYSSGALQRALLYVKPFGGLIFSHAEDTSLRNGAYINESKNTASLGLKSFAPHVEFTAIAREIEIVKYTGSRIHFSHLSTGRSVELIRQAKRSGLNISCDVSILHLIYNDEVMNGFDANLKLMPPLRDEEDRLALIEGINDGTIDCIVSDHNPQCPEFKLVEFNYSPFGAITLQLVYSLYNRYLSDAISLETFVKCVSENPRSLLNLEKIDFQEKKLANFSIFNPNLSWTLDHSSNSSLSANTHLWGSELKGKCIFTANKGYINLNT